MYFNILESLRGVAAFLVLAFHLGLFPNGWIMVDFFFIISGFVISFTYFDKLKSKKTSLFEFMKKRFFRLYPLHFLLLMIFVIFKGFDYDKNNTFLTLTSNIFLTHGWLNQNQSWVYPSWSISIEFYLYMFFGVSLITIRTNKLLKIFSTANILISAFFLGSIDEFYIVNNHTGPLRGVMNFNLGIILYIIYNSFGNLFINRRFTIIQSSLLLIAIFYLCFISIESSVIFYFINSIILSGLTLTFIFGKETTILNFLTKKPFVFLGSISYSFYLMNPISLILFNKLRIFNLPETFLLMVIFLFHIFSSFILYISVEKRFRSKN